MSAKPFRIKNDPKVILHTCFYAILSALLICCIVFSAYKIIRWRAENDVADEQIKSLQADSAVSVIEVPAEENPDLAVSLINVDLSSAKSVNPETVGWIKVPGTQIDYPFVQTNDNEFYLSHSLNRAWNSAGWVFLDYRNSKSLNNNNQIIYAHGRVDGSMFGSLVNVLDKSWQENPANHIVQISTDEESSLWQVFSVYEIPATNDYITVDFADEAAVQDFLNLITKRSDYGFKHDALPTDKILTLSTCVGADSRAVLHAKLVKTIKK